MAAMDLEAHNCNQILATIASALHTNRPASLGIAIYSHINTCDRCRTGLLLLRGFALDPDQAETDQECASSQADLAAFIELEMQDAALAAATYPHVWWHVWTCPTCAETYRFTHMLLDAHQAGELPPLRPPQFTIPSKANIIQQIRLPRDILLLTLPKHGPSRAVMRGTANRYVLFDESQREPEQRQCTIVAQEQADGNWQIIVTKRPARDALLVFTSGDLRLVAPFSPEGTATIGNIDPQVLLEPNSPDIEIGIAVQFEEKGEFEASS